MFEKRGSVGIIWGKTCVGLPNTSSINAKERKGRGGSRFFMEHGSEKGGE